MDELHYPLLGISRLRMGTDGMGVTTLVAGSGCPLNCRWCINRKLLREAVPESVTGIELLERVKIDDLYFQTTGGGITFGGGESLLHAAFIRHFRGICPEQWRIRVETSLAVPAELAEIAVGAADDFIVDCKEMDPGIYERYTGGESERMRENLRLLIHAVGTDHIYVRVPLIPEYNTAEDQERSVKALQQMGIKHIERFSYVRRE